MTTAAPAGAASEATTSIVPPPASIAPTHEPEPPATAAAAAAAKPGGDDDAEGARLIALNMALNGTSREETDRYLAENFELPDRAKLLDAVYASIGQ